MSTLNINFPQTDVVSVVFCYKNYTNRTSYEFDENNIVVESQKRTLKQYYYRVPPTLVGKLKKGDMVVVNCSTGYQVAEVTVTNTYAPKSEPVSYIVGVVDKDSYFEFLEDQKKLAVLREQLEAEKKRIESMVTYELLAERSPEFKALLDAFKAMGGTVE